MAEKAFRFNKAILDFGKSGKGHKWVVGVGGKVIAGYNMQKSIH